MRNPARPDRSSCTRRHPLRPRRHIPLRARSARRRTGQALRACRSRCSRRHPRCCRRRTLPRRLSRPSRKTEHLHTRTRSVLGALSVFPGAVTLHSRAVFVGSGIRLAAAPIAVQHADRCSVVRRLARTDRRRASAIRPSTAWSSPPIHRLLPPRPLTNASSLLSSTRVSVHPAATVAQSASAAAQLASVPQYRYSEAPKAAGVPTPPHWARAVGSQAMRAPIISAAKNSSFIN